MCLETQEIYGTFSNLIGSLTLLITLFLLTTIIRTLLRRDEGVG
jgi:hypothetical protein